MSGCWRSPTGSPGLIGGIVPQPVSPMYTPSLPGLAARAAAVDGGVTISTSTPVVVVRPQWEGKGPGDDAAAGADEDGEADDVGNGEEGLLDDELKMIAAVGPETPSRNTQGGRGGHGRVGADLVVRETNDTRWISKLTG